MGFLMFKMKGNLSMSNFFCPKCGTKLKNNTRFCPKCGTNVQNVSDNMNNNSSKTTKLNRKYSELKTALIQKNKLTYLILLFLILIFFIWGHIYYSEDNQLARAIRSIEDPNQNAAKYIFTPNSRVKVNKQSVKGIQNYFQKYPNSLNSMQNCLEEGKDYYSYSFKQDGRVFLFWKRYKIQVDPVYITVNTDQKGMNITMDGQKLGKVTSNDANSDNSTSDVSDVNNSNNSYTREFGPYLPGLHRFVGTKEVNGHKIKSVVTSSDTNITMNNGISNDMAKSLLDSAFTSNVDNNDEIFVNGQNNKYYKQLVDMYNGYRNDKNITESSQTVNVNKVTPVSDREFKVDYQVKYAFINQLDDGTQKKTQIFKYTATIIKTNDTNASNYNGLKIKSLGHAKKVSESTSDDND